MKIPEKIALMLKRQFSEKSFQQDCTIFYNRQVPNVALYLISGKMELCEQKKKQIIRPGHIVGLAQLYNQWVCSASASISAGSIVISLDRATLFSLVEKGSELGQFFQKYLEGMALAAPQRDGSGNKK